jgi:hypothetical protein
MLMRPLILCLAMLAAFPASAQTGAPSKAALDLGGRVARAADPRIEQNLQALVANIANSYRTAAGRSGTTVDETALAEVSKSEAAAAAPLVWDGMARIYAEIYSLDELKALNAFYRDNPGAAPQALPISLGSRNADLQRREQELVGQIGPRILQDFFGDYCSRAPCSNDIRRAAGLPVKAGG